MAESIQGNGQGNRGKFQNLHLARGQNVMRSHGTFDAIVRLARPEYRPSYMKILGQFSPGFMRAEIDYTAFPEATADRDVLAVELRAYQSQAPAGLQ